MKPGILYAGNHGSFSWEATRRAQAQKGLGLEGLEPIESLDPPTTIRRFWAGEVSHAVVPIFNPMLGGVVPKTKEGFLEVGCPLPSHDTAPEDWVARFIELNKDRVIGQAIPLPIDFCIHALPGVKPEEVTRLAAYSMAVKQCYQGIARVVGRTFEDVPYSDTGKAAGDLRKLADDPNFANLDPESRHLEPLSQTGVLGPHWCAKLFGLQTLWSGVQDLPQGNVTTFVILRNPNLV